MGYERILDGMYLVVQRSERKGVVHEAILIAQRWFDDTFIDASDPIVVHQVPPRIRRDQALDTGPWMIVAKIADGAGAMRRLMVAIRTPNYHLLWNNCQHFARYIAYGKKESPQVQTAFVILGTVWLASALAERVPKKTRPRRAA